MTDPTEPIDHLLPSLRDFKWEWRDLLIGLAPLLFAILTPHRISRELLASPWLWVIGAVLATAWMLCYPLAVARIRPALPRPRSFIIELAITLPVALVMLVLASLTSQALARWSSGPVSPLEPLARSRSITLTLLAVLGAPVAEEVFYRGMLFNALRQRMPMLLATMVQGIAFGLMHPFGMTDRIAISLMGSCLAIFYEWRKVLLAPILVHATINVVGISVLTWTAANAPVLGIRGDTGDQGCLVTTVMPGSAADLAGLQVGDVITAVDGVPVHDLRGVTGAVRAKRIGDALELEVIRDGDPMRMEATLKGHPSASAP